MSKKSVIIHGHTGRMGQMLVSELSNHKNLTFGGGISQSETIDSGGSTTVSDDHSHLQLLQSSSGLIDFSLPSSAKNLLSLASKSKNKSFLICTTGLDESVIDGWQKSAKDYQHKVMVAPNTSVGIALFRKVLDQFGKTLQKYGFDAEVIETHHRYKKDAPSGTALYLAEALQTSKTELVGEYQGERKEHQIGMHAIRGGGVYGEHEVRFISDHEEVSFSHRALDRKLFASGALVLLNWLEAQSSGFYHFKDVDL